MPRIVISYRRDESGVITTPAMLNLVWNPVPFADLGIGFFRGHRMVLSNLKGDLNATIGRFLVVF